MNATNPLLTFLPFLAVVVVNGAVAGVIVLAVVLIVRSVARNRRVRAQAAATPPRPGDATPPADIPYQDPQYGPGDWDGGPADPPADRTPPG